MAEKIEIDQIEDGFAKIDGSNIPPLTHWTNLHAGGLDGYVFHGGQVGSNFNSVFVEVSGGIFQTNKSGLQSWLGITDVGDHKSKTIPLTSAYRRSVIPLCILDNTNISLDSYFFGNVYAKRNNSLGSRLAGAAIEVGKLYNSTNPVVSFTYSDSDSSTFFKPVTFIYGGLKYFGLEIGAISSSFSYAIVDGMSDNWSYIDAVEFMNTQTSTVLNAEINNSITDYSYTNDTLNKTKISLFNQKAQAFIKHGSTDANVLLGAGGEAPLINVDQFNITATTNVYTFSILLSNLVQKQATLQTNTTHFTITAGGVLQLNTAIATQIANGNTAFGWGNFRDYGLGLVGGATVTNNDLDTADASGFFSNGSGVQNSAFSGSSGGFINFKSGISGSRNIQLDFIGNNALEPRAAIRHQLPTGYTVWREFITEGNLDSQAIALGFVKSAALGVYVLQSSLTSQLANYVTANGVQNITATKTFTVSPVVPNGTLVGHAVNLGQMQSYVTGLGYQTAAQVTAIVNSAISGVPSPGNGSVVLQGVNALTGTATFSMNQSNNVVGSFDLSTATKSDIQKGIDAFNFGDHAAAGYMKASSFNADAYQHIKRPPNGTIAIGNYRKTVISIFNASTTNITIPSNAPDGAELEIKGRTVTGPPLNVNIDHLDLSDSAVTSVPMEGGRIKFYFSKSAGVWERII